MKRFLLFAGDSYYPEGGMYDYVGDFDTLDEAEAALSYQDWGHTVDHATMNEVSCYQKPWDVPQDYLANPTSFPDDVQRLWKKMIKENEGKGWKRTE